MNTNATKPDRIAFWYHLILILLKRGTRELPATPWWLTNPSSLLLRFQRVFLITDADIDDANDDELNAEEKSPLSTTSRWGRDASEQQSAHKWNMSFRRHLIRSSQTKLHACCEKDSPTQKDYAETRDTCLRRLTFTRMGKMRIKRYQRAILPGAVVAMLISTSRLSSVSLLIQAV